MKFGSLKHQDKFFSRGLVWRKVSGRLAADVQVEGDGRVVEFSDGEDVGEILDDEQAEAKLQELAEEKRLKATEGEPLMAGYDPENGSENKAEAVDPEAIRKMKRQELDTLAKQNGIDLGDLNVEDSREYLVSALCKGT